MSKEERFRGPFEEQHGKRAQTLLKFASQHLYRIYWLLWGRLNWKKSLLVIWQIWQLFGSILAANDKYRDLNRDKLTIPIQMQLSQKEKTFPRFFSVFFSIWINSWKFWKKTMILIDFVFPNLRTAKTWLDKCLKSAISEDSSTIDMVNEP